VLGAFLVMQVLMAPVQHHVFESSCLGQRASEEDGENELRARRFATLADGPLYRNRWFLYPRVLIMLVIAATAYLRRRLPDQRKRVLLANFATTWVCHLVVNLRMLYLGVQQPVLSPAMIACQACLGLSCHLMLPLNPHRRRAGKQRTSARLTSRRMTTAIPFTRYGARASSCCPWRARPCRSTRTQSRGRSSTTVSAALTVSCWRPSETGRAWALPRRWLPCAVCSARV